jgi:uncharacterized membrane protein YgcG
MVPASVHRQTDNNSYQPKYKSSRACLTALLCLILVILILVWAGSGFAAEDRTLEQSGIRYPEGYDINTVGEVQGKVYGFVQPGKGPARFSIVSRRDTYTVFASPSWYWNDFGIKLKDGDVVQVIGSKSLGKDGNLYIIAQEVRVPASGQSLVFRGIDGTPLWKPFGSGASGGHGGFGSSAGGRGGVGAGGGGAGRGRR